MRPLGAFPLPDGGEGLSGMMRKALEEKLFKEFKVGSA